ncbi:MAG: AAA domain-containing protein [Salinivirgaceae bacterium]|nr:AAA domain-containing protein [Salinivirgaceae bacterium]
MKNFAKSILNYFAAFNETRFRFGSKLSYEWSNDSFTLDFSVFPVFQEKLLGAVVLGSPFRFEIHKGEYAVQLDSDEFKTVLLSRFETELNEEFLDECIEEFRVQLQEANPEMDPSEFEGRAIAEGLREYNLIFRKKALESLTGLQDEKIKALQREYAIRYVPVSTFNPQREVQRLFDELQNIAASFTESTNYLAEAKAFIESQSFDLVIFDLHALLRRYLQFVGSQSLYIFFHEIANKGRKYPLYTVEVNIQDGQQNLAVESLRNAVMLNTPAINSFEFDSILTTPRAAKLEEAAGVLNFIEKFLQAKYDVTENFIFSSSFQPLTRDGLPEVSFRLGLQAVKEEDRRILDYTELITGLDEGAGQKFIGLVERYVDGNVQSTADDVQKAYTDSFPRKSTERLASSVLSIPMNLNETQNKILMAVRNPKNEIIVVDGPPGTGKSYAIAAIVYLANSLNKSVVITSHKKQALDVIDAMLTDRFKKLHPRSKPAVLRLEKPGGPATLNSMDNTLASQVINGARNRAYETNRDAVAADRTRLFQEIDESNKLFWENQEQYQDRVQKAFILSQEEDALFGGGACIDPVRLPAGASIPIDRIRKMAENFQDHPLSISLDAFASLFARRNELPEVLEKCDRLNAMSASIPAAALGGISSAPDGLEFFEEIVAQLAVCLEKDVPLGEISLDSLSLQPPHDFGELTFQDLLSLKTPVGRMAELEGKLMGRLLKGKDIKALRQDLEGRYPEALQQVDQKGSQAFLESLQATLAYVDSVAARYPGLAKDYVLSGFRRCSSDSLASLLARLGSLEFQPVTQALGDLLGMPFFGAGLGQIQTAIVQLKNLIQYSALRKDIAYFAELVNSEASHLAALYSALKKAQGLLDKTDLEDLQALALLFRHYGPVLGILGIEQSSLATLGQLLIPTDRSERFFRYFQLHMELSSTPPAAPPFHQLLDDYFGKTQKLVENGTDMRFSDLVNHAADVQRVQTAIAAGRRISPEQARVLLSHLACILSEPGLISQYFPMEADMIDLLIIDEASQVSIADSISLMLRARQTLVFGDELQYGAVSAVNVSERYSAQYFKDILRDYAIDRNQIISEEEKERLAREASRELPEDEQESTPFIPVTPGTREWLKTFSIRTSTLAFAKALSNYSESLNVHFRSFPEIISYSSEYFYKESQIELVPNRIRTKPIGDVLRFMKVETQGNSGRRVNLDEIEAIKNDIERVIAAGYRGTIGVICSFQDQKDRMEEIFRKEMKIHPDLVRNHRFTVWFVGDVQGEERDLIYYSFVEDKKLSNGSLRDIYPVIGGAADNIRKLKMQRLNVGFSRAKDTMVFVHSMPLIDYSDTRLGNALLHYEKMLHAAHDQYVEDESVFDSPAEKELYRLILQTNFFQAHRDSLRLIAQFEIGKYLREEYSRNLPNYRVDFLLTQSQGGKEKSLIIEYDGVEFHTRNPEIVTRHNFDQEYLEYDIQRQLELESYGYSFLRIHKYSLIPTPELPTRVAVLNHLLEGCFADL